MKRITTTCLTALLLAPAMAAAGPEKEAEDQDVLMVRYACLVGGREAGSAPTSSGVLSSEELSQFLLEWEPSSDNEEVRKVFALNELGEMVRQAAQIPLEGGQVSGLYTHGESDFEIGMQIDPMGPEEVTAENPEGVAMIRAMIARDGEPLSAPNVRVPIGERAIISTSTNGGQASFLFLVVEVDQISSKELRSRGLRHAWRKDYMLVDGEEVTQPVAISKTPPRYPAEARKEKYQGAVILRMVISKEGVVEDIEVVQGHPYGLTEAAIEAARTWTFEPALHKDEPVGVIYLVTINFRLE